MKKMIAVFVLVLASASVCFGGLVNYENITLERNYAYSSSETPDGSTTVLYAKKSIRIRANIKGDVTQVKY